MVIEKSRTCILVFSNVDDKPCVREKMQTLFSFIGFSITKIKNILLQKQCHRQWQLMINCFAKKYNRRL